MPIFKSIAQWVICGALGTDNNSIDLSDLVPKDLRKNYKEEHSQIARKNHFLSWKSYEKYLSASGFLRISDPDTLFLTEQIIWLVPTLKSLEVSPSTLANPIALDFPEMNQLQSLTVNDCRISAINGAENLTRLTRLNLNCIFEEDEDELTSLLEIQSLKHIKLVFNSLKNIQGLRKLGKLQSLNLTGCPISEFNANQDFPQLDTLVLKSTLISHVGGLQHTVSLVHLDISATEVSDLAPLSNLSFLTFLDLSHTKVEGLKELNSLEELASLNLSSTLVTDIAPLKSVTKLEKLMLNDLRIETVGPLKNLRQLTLLEICSVFPRNLKKFADRVKDCVIVASHDNQSIILNYFTQSATAPEDEECAICLEEFDKEPASKLTHCGHFFHKDCISKWLLNTQKVIDPWFQSSCPNCRSKIGLPDDTSSCDEEEEIEIPEEEAIQEAQNLS